MVTRPVNPGKPAAVAREKLLVGFQVINDPRPARACLAGAFE